MIYLLGQHPTLKDALKAEQVSGFDGLDFRIGRQVVQIPSGSTVVSLHQWVPPLEGVSVVNVSHGQTKQALLTHIYLQGFYCPQIKDAPFSTSHLIGRRNGERLFTSVNDTSRPYDFWQAVIANITTELVFHVIDQKVALVGKKVPCHGPRHEWIRSVEGGWQTSYENVTLPTIQYLNLLEVPVGVVKSLGLSCGCVAMGYRAADESAFVFDVEANPLAIQDEAAQSLYLNHIMQQATTRIPGTPKPSKRKAVAARRGARVIRPVAVPVEELPDPEPEEEAEEVF